MALQALRVGDTITDPTAVFCSDGRPEGTDHYIHINESTFALLRKASISAYSYFANSSALQANPNVEWKTGRATPACARAPLTQPFSILLPPGEETRSRALSLSPPPSSLRRREPQPPGRAPPPLHPLAG